MTKTSFSPDDSRYVPLVQQKHCCVPACISMIMLKRGVPLIPQEVIGGELGLMVSDEDADKFWNAKTGQPYPAGLGTNVGFEEGKVNPNEAFERLEIPLEIKINNIDNFKNLEEFTSHLKELVQNDRDTMVCFDWGEFSNQKEKKWGHVCLLDSIYADKNEVRLIDPSYNQPKWQATSTEKLFDAMKAHTAENGAGFWEVEQI